jgi:hypothetical protein
LDFADIKVSKSGGFKMKNLKFINVITFLIAGIFLGGCYTQVATRDSDYEYERQSSREYDDYQSESDSEYYNEDDYYYESDGAVINNYYLGSYPNYRRYFSSYYPTVSIGVSFGTYWGWDPYCYSSFYYPWCYNSWYYPAYYSYYYPGFYYPRYYGYGYGYGGYYKNPVYKERSRDNISIRNNDGLRGGSGGRGDVTRDRNPVISTDRTTTTRERTGLRDGSNRTVREREKTTEPPTSVERERKRVETDKSTDRNKTRIDSERERKRIDVRQEGNRNDEVKRREAPRVIQREKQQENVRKPQIKRETNTNETKRQRTYDKDKKSNPPQRTYTPPKRTNTPPKTYNPPQRTSPPPKSNTPPQRSTPPPSSRGNNSGGDSGKRTR